MTDKSFDVHSSSSGYPIAETLPDAELAGASQDKATNGEERRPEDARPIFPVNFDRDVSKDFRPIETAEVETVPKGSYAQASASEEPFSLTSLTGLEDVSLEDQEPTSALPSAAKDT